eukprot:363151-Chlamydomonas_euryale.AAC.2
MYAKTGVLCGNDGLPHLIADPGLALRYGHAGEIFVSENDVHGTMCMASVGLHAIILGSEGDGNQLIWQHGRTKKTG